MTLWLIVLQGTDDDLEYYTREAGEILGISHKLNPDKRDGKHILEYVLKQVRGNLWRLSLI